MICNAGLLAGIALLPQAKAVNSTFATLAKLFKCLVSANLTGQEAGVTLSLVFAIAVWLMICNAGLWAGIALLPRAKAVNSTFATLARLFKCLVSANLTGQEAGVTLSLAAMVFSPTTLLACCWRKHQTKALVHRQSYFYYPTQVAS